jgi:hypothetical protein
VAILSTFYDTSPTKPETLINEGKWSQAHPHIGSSEYGVDQAGDFDITAHPTTPFAVNVSIGQAWGHGIFDESTTVFTVPSTPPAAGTTRWDLVAIRRDWSPIAGGPSSIVAVEGGAVKAIPDARQNDPGTLDDQPLWLVQWTAGQTQPTAYVDLRVWAGNGGAYAKDALVRTYLNRVGTEININGEVWSYQPGANSVAAWVKVFEFGKIPLFGLGSSLAGGTPPAGTQFLFQAGTHKGKADVAGFDHIPLQRRFPNGLLTVLFSNGDTGIDRGVGSALSFGTAGGTVWGTGKADDIVYYCEKSNGSPYFGDHRVNFIAIGW